VVCAGREEVGWGVIATKFVTLPNVNIHPGYKADRGWKTTLLTSVFLLPTSVNSVPHGTMLMADFADVHADVDRC
jgi:hypothetical protein